MRFVAFALLLLVALATARPQQGRSQNQRFFGTNLLGATVGAIQGGLAGLFRPQYGFANYGGGYGYGYPSYGGGYYGGRYPYYG